MWKEGGAILIILIVLRTAAFISMVDYLYVIGMLSLVAIKMRSKFSAIKLIAFGIMLCFQNNSGWLRA